MPTRIKAVCQSAKRNNGIMQTLFICSQEPKWVQEEQILVNLRIERGSFEEGCEYELVFKPLGRVKERA